MLNCLSHSNKSPAYFWYEIPLNFPNYWKIFHSLPHTCLFFWNCKSNVTSAENLSIPPLISLHFEHLSKNNKPRSREIFRGAIDYICICLCLRLRCKAQYFLLHVKYEIHGNIIMSLYYVGLWVKRKQTVYDCKFHNYRELFIVFRGVFFPYNMHFSVQEYVSIISMAHSRGRNEIIWTHQIFQLTNNNSNS